MRRFVSTKCHINIEKLRIGEGNGWILYGAHGALLKIQPQPLRGRYRYRAAYRNLTGCLPRWYPWIAEGEPLNISRWSLLCMPDTFKYVCLALNSSRWLNGNKISMVPTMHSTTLSLVLESLHKHMFLPLRLHLEFQNTEWIFPLFLLHHHHHRRSCVQVHKR